MKAAARTATSLLLAASCTSRLFAQDMTVENLAQLTFAGHLREQGIPSGSQLCGALDAGDLTAEDILQAAYAAGEASLATAENADMANRLLIELTGNGRHCDHPAAP